MNRNLVCIALLGSAVAAPAADLPVPLPNPVLFVTQVPVPGDFTTIGSTFGNHEAWMQDVGRGGDLWIRYPDGTLKNLTAAAGFGNAGFQGAGSIAVRDPCVHWSGTKALFSMVVGAPTQQYVWLQHYWQIYEVSGLGAADTPVITKLPYQPASRNNVQPVYGSDDRVLFASDRPRNGAQHLYPQLDEYETAPTVAGLYSLDPQVGDLFLVTHAPSGDFTPLIDSFGRLLFTRWDHLQRDQQADADNGGGGSVYGTFNWSDESPQSVALPNNDEVFPEPRPGSPSLPAGSNLNGHTFNHFFPWMATQDGTGLEVLNHIGRHELHAYFNRSFNDDPNLVEFIAEASSSVNPNRIEQFFHIAEDPAQPGRYVGVNAPEFSTHCAGQLVAITAPPGANPDNSIVQFVTHPDTASYTNSPGPNHSGLYREPQVLANGLLIAVHTTSTQADANIGTFANPKSKYAFRVKTTKAAGAYQVADLPLTEGITKSVNYWSPDVLISYTGELWELNPVEVVARPRPAAPTQAIEAPELAAFAAAGVDAAQFRAWLYQNGLALIVSRDVTSRDDADHQQPFNIRVAGTTKQSVGAGGKLYDVAWLQLFQGDQIRGLGGAASPNAGRRVLAQPMHDDLDHNPPLATAPDGSVKVAGDGSVAALVPARRAMTWQLTDGQGTAVVRERYWMSFQPGEVRACTSCHGQNTLDQAGKPPAQTTPQALVDLLKHWQQSPPPAPTLPPAGAGNVGMGQGGPFDVLTINGSAGGADRRVDVAAGAGFTIALATPPTFAGNAHFALFGLMGAPSAAIGFDTAIGTLLFPPIWFAPALPGFFTLADNLIPDPGALLPSTATPWSLAIPQGLAFPLTVTLQGVIQDGPKPLSVTNGVILRVQ